MSTDAAAGWFCVYAPDDGWKHRPKHVEQIKVTKKNSSFLLVINLNCTSDAQKHKR